MKNVFIITCLILIGAYFISCKPKSAHAFTLKDSAMTSHMTKEDSIKRGEYLVQIMGCNDCHTPKVMTDKGPMLDMDRLLSGHPSSEPLPPAPADATNGTSPWVLLSMGGTAAIGPWGTSFAGNLTPDETGTGNWSFDNFRKVIREGKFKGLDGGRMIMPPMPWETFSAINDEDLANLWMYLQSLKPVKNIVPAYIAPGTDVK